MSDNRDKRSILFDRIAALSDRFRPGYPDAVFEAAIAFSQLPDAIHAADYSRDWVKYLSIGRLIF
jgi:hypothetical protein